MLTTYKEDKKRTPTQIPQGGWGPGSNEPTQTLFCFYNDARKCILVLKLGSKGLQLVRRIIFM